MLLTADDSVGKHAFKIRVGNLPLLRTPAYFGLQPQRIFMGEDELSDRAKSYSRLLVIQSATPLVSIFPPTQSNLLRTRRCEKQN
jgi:hypothetical protein